MHKETWRSENVLVLGKKQQVMEGGQTWDESCAIGSARFNSNTSRGACSRSAAPTAPPPLTTDGAPAGQDSALDLMLPFQATSCLTLVK